MALNRSPTSVLVNGVALLIKDGDTEAGLFGARFQRVPGLANFTLPDETGSVNETQLQDGPIAAAQIAGVGTITGSIGALTAHPTHKFLAAKRRTGGTIRAVILRPAQTVVSEAADNGVAVSAAIDDGQTTAKDILSVVTLDAARRDIREGFLAAVHTAAPKGHLDYNAAAAASMARFQSILSINDSGLKFSVSPGVSGAIAKAVGTAPVPPQGRHPLWPRRWLFVHGQRLRRRRFPSGRPCGGEPQPRATGSIARQAG